MAAILEPQGTRGSVGLHVCAATLFALVGLVAGFGPSWMRYSSEKKWSDGMQKSPRSIPELKPRPDLPSLTAIRELVGRQD